MKRSKSLLIYLQPVLIMVLGVTFNDYVMHVVFQATNGSTPVTNVEGAKVEEEKSDEYSNNMTEAMGAGKLTMHYTKTSAFEGSFLDTYQITNFFTYFLQC